MAAKRNRYREMERYLTAILIADAVLFLLFLLYSGLGIIWGKVLAAILVVLMSGLSLGFLYLTGELMRRRSLWMSAGFAAIALCLVVSLICNYPSPSKTKAANAPAPPVSTSDPSDASTPEETPGASDGSLDPNEGPDQDAGSLAAFTGGWYIQL